MLETDSGNHAGWRKFEEEKVICLAVFKTTFNVVLNIVESVTHALLYHQLTLTAARTQMKRQWVEVVDSGHCHNDLTLPEHHCMRLYLLTSMT